MAGHSQFANIMHRKNAQDQKRSKIFQKIVREINVAVRLHGTNIDSNAKLRLVLTKAKALNMPKDIINRAINKAQNQDCQYEFVTYEGYGPNAVAFMIVALTDNKKRTISNIRGYFNKCNSRLGTTNSVQHLFNKVGVIEFLSDKSVDDITIMLIDDKIMTLQKYENKVEVIFPFEDLEMIMEKLVANGISEFVTSEIQNRPLTTVRVHDEKVVASLEKLLSLLEEDDDVQTVTTNWIK